MKETADPRLMRGAELAQKIVDQSAERAQAFERHAGRRPCLAAVLVGEDRASATYVKMKRERCEQAGIDSRLLQLPGATTTEDLISAITELSDDPAVDGILLQHPVPHQIDERAAFEAITPEKDVDGVTLRSFGAMAFGLPGFTSCTPGGIVRLLDAYGVDPRGKRAVVVGRSPILGKPIAALLVARDATVTVCHSKTVDLPEAVRAADIVIAAVGEPNFIRGGWIRPGAVVIDAGYNEGNVGDVAFDEARERASLITPVPGGVGPMTVATLIEQTADAAWRSVP